MSKPLRWTAALIAAVLGVLMVPFAVPVLSKVGGVSASASGTIFHADVLQSGDTRVEDTEVGFSGAVFDSSGLGKVRLNEMARAFGPKLPSKLASALGSPLEIGLGVDPTMQNQVIIAGRAEVAGPPNVGVVTKEAGPIDVDPLVYAALLRGQSWTAAADDGCALGSDASRGLAFATDVQLLDAASGASSRNTSSNKSGAAVPSVAAVPHSNTSNPKPAGGATSPAASILAGLPQGAKGLTGTTSRPAPSRPAAATSAKPPVSSGPAAPAKQSKTAAADPAGLEQPVVALDATDPARAISQSKSRTVFVAQRDRKGKLLGNMFGIMSEVRETIAPVTLFEGTDNQLTIEFLGEWVLQSIAGGIPGTGYVHYGPNADTPDTPVLRLINSSGEQRIITLQQLVTKDGLVVTIPGVAEVAIGEPPRAIGGAAGSKPLVTTDGTKAAAAVDVVRVVALPGAPVRLTDIRVGHMETQAQVPAGGVSCSIPVKKTPTPDSVNVGDQFTVDFLITNPYDCTLSNVALSDVITTEDGARFEVLSTDPVASSSPTGSSLSNGTIQWSGLGDIAPHKSRTLHATFAARGGSGAILDVATATAKLTKCADKGASVAGVDVGVVNGSITGMSTELRVPVVATEVKAAFSNRLPRTGAAIVTLVIASLGLIGLGATGVAAARRLG